VTGAGAVTHTPRDFRSRGAGRVREHGNRTARAPGPGTAQEAHVTSDTARPQAREPEDLGRLFVERANAGDLEGLVALYEPDAVLAAPPGPPVTGRDAIREVLRQFLAGRPTLTGQVRPALRNGDLALTSTGFTGGATGEIARRQPDGSWLYAVDQPRIVPGP
jgi:uncharacterized protein (TIGR02246 family)